jgi:dihydroorotate dehydrogenase (NAD+) catalytic subunit
MVDLSVEIAGIRMKNPVMNASGTMDANADTKDPYKLEEIGAYVHKTITLKPREGNPQPRIIEVCGGMLNRIGLQNVGIEAFMEEKLPPIFNIFPDTPIIISIAGETIQEYERLAEIIQKRAGGIATAIEANVSCPNVANGLAFGCNTDSLFAVVSGIKAKLESMPLIVKLTPNVTDIAVMAKVAERAGADVISLINTLKGTALAKKGPSKGSWVTGGFSGPAIKPIALYMVSEVAKSVGIPIIGMGGISGTEDALDFLRAGASAISVGTANFGNPGTMAEIINGLSGYLKEKGYANIVEFKEKEGKS